MKETTPPCCTSKNGNYVIACSGGCDLGNLSDLIARKLSREGVRKMNCLAIIGAGNNEKINCLKKSNLLVIDGCDGDCAKKIVEKAGFQDFYYLRITDLGYKKDKTGVSIRTINSVYRIAKRLN